MDVRDDASRRDRTREDADPEAGDGNFGRCLFFTVLLAIPLWGIIGAVCYRIIH